MPTPDRRRKSEIIDRGETMKKKRLIVITAILTIILLFPIPMQLKDGGTVQYRALLYKISDVHALASTEDMDKGKEYSEGAIIEICGFEVYNSVK